ncbi:MAG TPA: helix-turn-helix domain-containing protein [Gaiellaceae bacterium]
MPKPSSSPSDPLWQTFVAAIAADTDSVGLTAARIAELPSYRTIPLAELVPDIRRNFASGLRRLQERRLATTDQDLSAYEKSGGQRARQGVTLADMLQGFSIAMAVSRAGAYRSAPPGEHRETLLLEAIEIMASSNTEGMNAAAAAHRQVEFELARQEQHDVANIVRRVLFGSIGGRAQLGHLERYGIDPTRRYHAVRVRPDDGFGLAEIERWLGTSESTARRNGLVALIDGDVAGFVADRPSDGEVPVVAGVAGPVALGSLADAFRLASRALETAHAIGRHGLVELPALGLTPAVLADDDVGSGVVERYVTPLEQRGRSGAVVLDTLERYLDNDCQVQRTATELGVHPNTVRYRVSRFEQLTGCSLKHNESLVEAWWALRRRVVA